MEEIWRDIENYEGLYKISNLGRIKSLKRKEFYSDGRIRFYEDKIISGHKTKFGYIYVFLYKNRKKEGYMVHRLVALSFIDNYENKKTVNHKNSIKTDNSLINLEWATHEEQMNHCKLNKNKHINYGDSVHNSITILCLTTGIYYESINEAYSSGLFKKSCSNFKERLRGFRVNNTNFIRV